MLIQGARRVGKSTVAEEFATNEYDTHILVDFAACSSEIRDLFNDVSDLNRIFMRLQLEYGIELRERKSESFLLRNLNGLLSTFDCFLLPIMLQLFIS